MSNRHISASDLNTTSNNKSKKEAKMALGKYAVDFEMRVDYDRLRKDGYERLSLWPIDELMECWLPYK